MDPGCFLIDLVFGRQTARTRIRIAAEPCARVLRHRRPRKTPRERRESRMRAAPSVSSAKENRKRTRAYRFSGGNPAFPARWVTAYSALSPVTGLSCHRHPRKVLLFANLTPASGRQDHTASPSTPPALVVRSPRVHRIPPRVRDDREPPLSSGKTRGVMPVICTT